MYEAAEDVGLNYCNYFQEKKIADVPTHTRAHLDDVMRSVNISVCTTLYFRFSNLNLKPEASHRLLIDPILTAVTRLFSYMFLFIEFAFLPNATTVSSKHYGNVRPHGKVDYLLASVPAAKGI
jgi:hypothetical protein